MKIKVGINGFGRIGRLVFRAAWNHPEVEVVAINDLADGATMAHLLKYDSVHGRFETDITAQNDRLQVNGNSVAIRSIKEPDKIDWRKLGVDIVAECTGLFRDREGASRHLAAGARKVIISAPAGDPDITIVIGVNSNQYDPRRHHIISNASCTTNCLAPVAKVILENFGLKYGLMTTIHAYTGDQRLLDFPHKDLRRARAAALSMVPTTTGAAKAVSLVLPELSGKLNGLGHPGPDAQCISGGLCGDGREIRYYRIRSELGFEKRLGRNPLSGILGYSEAPLVSCDFNGSSFSSIVDAPTNPCDR